MRTQNRELDRAIYMLEREGCQIINVERNPNRLDLTIIYFNRMKGGYGYYYVPVVPEIQVMSSSLDSNQNWVDQIAYQQQAMHQSGVSQIYSTHNTYEPSKKKCKSCGELEHKGKLDWRGRCEKKLEIINKKRSKLHSIRLTKKCERIANKSKGK